MNRTPLIVLGSTFLISLCLAALYAWFYFQIDAKNTLVADVTTQIQSKDQEDARLEALAALVNDTSVERAELAKHFVEKDGVASFLGELEALGKTANTKMEIVSVSATPLPEDDTHLHEQLALALTITGSFPRVLQTLSLIETLPYPNQMGQVRLEEHMNGKNREWTASVAFSVLSVK